MQCVPAVLLQELQHQGENQTQAQDGGSGGSPGRARRAESQPQPSPCAPDKTPLSFPQQNSTPSRPQPAPTQFSHESSNGRASPGVSPWQALQVPERRRLQSGQESSPQPGPFLRSPTGSGTPTTTSWKTTSETLSPQLLGRGAGSDAKSLSASPRSINHYQALVTAQLRHLLSSSTSSAPLEPSPASDVDSINHRQQPSSPAPPAVQPSSLPATPSCASTQESDASSFAYDLRKRGPDLRMLKTQTAPLLSRPPKPFISGRCRTDNDSTLCYKPNTVEETGLVESTTKGIRIRKTLQPAMPLALPKMRRKDFIDIRPLRKAQSFVQQIEGDTPTHSSHLKRSTQPKRPIGPRSKSTNNILRLTTGPAPSRPAVLRQLRSEGVVVLESRKEEIPKVPSSAPPSKDRLLKSSITLPPSPFTKLKKLCHDMTPSDSDPRAVTPPYHSDHCYFTTFPLETMHGKEFVPLRTPSLAAEPQQLYGSPPAANAELLSPEVPQPSTPKIPHVSSKYRKKSSMSSIFKRNSLNRKNLDETWDATGRMFGKLVTPAQRPQPATPATPVTPATPATPATPGILVSSPADEYTMKRRTSSNMPEIATPSYFVRPRFRAEKSDSNLSATQASPLETIEDEEPSEHRIRSRQRKTSSSEHISPGAPSRSRPKARHRRTLNSFRDDSGSNRTPTPEPKVTTTKVEPQVADDSVNGTEQLQMAGNGNENFAAPITGNDTLERIPSRSESPHAANFEIHKTSFKRKRSVLRSFLNEIRRVSSADGLPEEAPPHLKQVPAPRLFLLRRMTISRLNLKTAKSSVPAQKLSRERIQVDKPLPKVPDEPSRSGRNSQDQVEVENCTSVIRDITTADLEVTDFEQTPFAQRYHDSKRATQQQIKALVEDSLNEDNDEDDEIVLGFEHDVPDHLPNSPLCPLQPKHKSGGKAICPLHGRYDRNRVSKVIRVGPSRSRRVLSLQSFWPSPLSAETSIGGNRMEILYDTRDVEPRASRMDIDGAWTSPVRGDQNIEVTIAMRTGQFSESESDMRGRKWVRDECGSRRIRRRVRARRL